MPPPPSAWDWNRLGGQSFHLGRKVKDRDIVLFNQEFVALIKAGYPILKSLETLSARIKNVHLREVLIKVSGEVEEGQGPVGGLPALREAVLARLYGQPDGRREGRQPPGFDRALHPIHEGHRPDPGRGSGRP